MSEAEESNGTLQNGHADLSIKSPEGGRVVETSNRYVPEPATGRDTRTNTGLSSGPERQATSNEPANNSVRIPHAQPHSLHPGIISKQPEPLHYFSYLGRLNRRSSKGFVSPRNILTSKPVIITSTSFVTPNVLDATVSAEQGEHEHRRTLDDPHELLELCTCMCCVKAAFYHCTKDQEDEGRLAEHPCSCQGPWDECAPRWSILGVLSLFLPCLWCYFPCRGCETVYARGRDWLAQRNLRARQARQVEASTESEASSPEAPPYEPVNLQRHEELRIHDPNGLLNRNRYVDMDTLSEI